MKGAEFLRKVKAFAKRKKLTYRWGPERGVGSHGTVYPGRTLHGREGPEERARTRPAGRYVRAARHSKGGPLMFTASYPAIFVPEERGEGFHVRFPDLPEALTGGDDLGDTIVQAADCLAEALAGRIARGDEIPQPSKAKRGQRMISVPLYLAPKLALYLAMRERRIPNTELAKR